MKVKLNERKLRKYLIKEDMVTGSVVMTFKIWKYAALDPITHKNKTAKKKYDQDFKKAFISAVEKQIGYLLV